MKRLIRFDWAVKRLLRNKANFGILEGFLSELLAEDIAIEEILESEGNQQTGDNKSNRVDLLVKNGKGELIIIEVQSNRMQDYLMRMLFGTSKLIVDNLDKGMDYHEIKKVISVNIVYFDLGQGSDYIYHGTTNFVGIHRQDILKLSSEQERLYHTLNISKLYPEYYIIKVNQFDDVARNTMDEWVYFLKNEEINDTFNARGLKQAKEGLDILKLTDSERREYDAFIADWRDFNSYTVGNFRAGMAAGEEVGIEKGIEQGIEIGTINERKKSEERLRDIARKCIEKGMNIDEIMEITGLPRDAIIALSSS